MNVVKMESPIGRTSNSAGSSTIFASPAPPVHSNYYFSDASTVAVRGGAGSFRRSGRYADDDDGDGDDDDDSALYSPDSIKATGRHEGHYRTQSTGNSSIVSHGLGVRSASDRDGSTESPTADGQPQKKKQKRNKPTLSCFECVERKTKAGLTHFIYPVTPVDASPGPAGDSRFTGLGISNTSSSYTPFPRPAGRITVDSIDEVYNSNNLGV